MKVKVRYIGSRDGLNHDVAAATGEGAVMVPGRTYAVPSELGDRLLSSPYFELATPVKSKNPKED